MQMSICRKEKAARRQEIYHKLEQQKLSEDQQKLLRPSKSFGQKVGLRGWVG